MDQNLTGMHSTLSSFHQAGAKYSISDISVHLLVITCVCTCVCTKKKKEKDRQKRKERWEKGCFFLALTFPNVEQQERLLSQCSVRNFNPAPSHRHGFLLHSWPVSSGLCHRHTHSGFWKNQSHRKNMILSFPQSTADSTVYCF